MIPGSQIGHDLMKPLPMSCTNSASSIDSVCINSPPHVSMDKRSLLLHFSSNSVQTFQNANAMTADRKATNSS